MAPKKIPVTSKKGSIQVAHFQEQIYCQIHGLATMEIANPFQAFTDSMLQKGNTIFLVDLKGCRGMDSTFMGVLIGIVTYEECQTTPEVKILNANTHNLKLLSSLGVSQVVTIVSEMVSVPETLTFSEIKEENPYDKIELIKKAHENLIDIEPKNAEQFAPFLNLLKQELDKK